jgi:hypothetical protein
MAPFNCNDPEIPAINRKPLLRPSGKAVAHDITPTRFVTETPTSVQGPVRARDYRRGKDRNAVAVDPMGTPQQASNPKPTRD